jgi:hypothetical protein
MSDTVADTLAAIGAEWRRPLTDTLASACAEIRRRISSGDGEDRLSTVELIGIVRTIGSINVEAGALLGDGEKPVDK